jgi:hypothetical protein
VYANGRTMTLVKFFALTTIYFMLLAITMMIGLAFTVLSLS